MGWAQWPDFTIPVPETSKNLGILAMKCQKRPKTGLFYLSESLSNLSRMIFSGQASDGSIYTDQGKQPDRTKNKNYHLKSSEKIIRKEIERERKQSDDEPFNRQEVYIL